MIDPTFVGRGRHLARFVLPAAAAVLLAVESEPPAMAQSTPPKLYNVSPTGVNLYDGAFTYTNTDLSIGPLKLERSFLDGPNSGHAYFGGNWSHNFDMWLSTSGPQGQHVVTVVLGRTKYVFYGVASDGALPDTDAVGTSIAQSGGEYLFTDRDGTAYRFGTGSKLVSSITKPDGSRLSFTYVSNKVRTMNRPGFSGGPGL